MKKIFTTILLVMVAVATWAYEAEVDGIYYNLVSKTKEAEVTFKGSTYYEVQTYGGSVVIPETIVSDGVTYSVASIGNYAFTDCYGLNSVSIPNSVTSIGNYAFTDCHGLNSVTIPNSLTSIGSGAFTGCYSLMSVTITDLTAWCKISFDNSYSNPLYYAHHLYLNGEEVRDLTIPNSVTSIGSSAFYGCSGLTSLTIPNSVTSVGNYAFQNCSGLTSLNITDLTAWCKISFNDCSSNPLRYAHHLYLNGEEIKDLTIPNSVNSIGNGAFYGCSGLTSVTIPNSVTSIGGYVFYGCTGLTSMTIPNSVTSIGNNAFEGCSGLTSVSIPNSVTSIRGAVFWSCTGLTSVTIPNSVTSIGSCAFDNCTGIKTISIGTGVKTIYSSAFASCKNIETVTCYAEKVPTMGTDVFKDSYVSYSTLKVPDASVDLYKAASQWKDFGTIKAIEGEPTTVNVVEGNTTQKEYYYYNINGTPSNSLQHGLNIIKSADGVKKIMVK